MHCCQTNAQYKQNNKITLREKAKQKHNCACGGKYRNDTKARHKRSKKHCEYINSSKTINNTGNTYNITINVNSVKDLEQLELDFLNAIK